MSFHIDHNPYALADVQRIFRYYKRRSPGAAIRFLEAMDKALSSISRNPLQYAEGDENTRTCLLKKYPYLVIYRKYHRSVTIFAVSHAKRRQQHWRKRLP